MRVLKEISGGMGANKNIGGFNHILIEAKEL